MKAFRFAGSAAGFGPRFEATFAVFTIAGIGSRDKTTSPFWSSISVKRKIFTGTTIVLAFLQVLGVNQKVNSFSMTFQFVVAYSFGLHTGTSQAVTGYEAEAVAMLLTVGAFTYHSLLKHVHKGRQPVAASEVTSPKKLSCSFLCVAVLKTKVFLLPLACWRRR